MPEKKQLTIEEISMMALNLAVDTNLAKQQSLELHKMVFNQLSPKVIDLSLEENQTMQLFFAKAAEILLKAKAVTEIIYKEKLDALPEEKKIQRAKEWEEIQAKRAKSGVQQTIDKDPKVVEKKVKKEKEIVVRKAAAVRLSFEDKAIKGIQKINPKLSYDEAKAQLYGKLGGGSAGK